MHNHHEDKLISFSELALICFALLLLAAAPAKTYLQPDPAQQPVKHIIQEDQQPNVILKSA